MTIPRYYAEQPADAREAAEAHLGRILKGVAEGRISPHQSNSAKMEAIWNALGLPDRLAEQPQQ